MVTTDPRIALITGGSRGLGETVFTATPGTESHEKLALLAVLGQQRMSG